MYGNSNFKTLNFVYYWNIYNCTLGLTIILGKSV